MGAGLDHINRQSLARPSDKSMKFEILSNQMKQMNAFLIWPLLNDDWSNVIETNLLKVA